MVDIEQVNVYGIIQQGWDFKECVIFVLSFLL